MGSVLKGGRPTQWRGLREPQPELQPACATCYVLQLRTARQRAGQLDFVIRPQFARGTSGKFPVGTWMCTETARTRVDQGRLQCDELCSHASDATQEQTPFRFCPQGGLLGLLSAPSIYSSTFLLPPMLSSMEDVEDFEDILAPDPAGGAVPTDTATEGGGADGDGDGAGGADEPAEDGAAGQTAVEAANSGLEALQQPPQPQQPQP